MIYKVWEQIYQEIFSNCYSRVTITNINSRYDVGGFQGEYAAGNSCSLYNCYSVLTTNTTGRTGPFSANRSNDNTDTKYLPTMQNYFYDNEVFNLSIPAVSNRTGLTTAQMGVASNYTNWDFKENDEDTEYTWYIDPETGYPELHF